MRNLGEMRALIHRDVGGGQQLEGLGDCGCRTERGRSQCVKASGQLTLPLCACPQYRKGGPIIAVQVENEYGSFHKDEAYMPYLHKVRHRGLCFLPLLHLTLLGAEGDGAVWDQGQFPCEPTTRSGPSRRCRGLYYEVKHEVQKLFSVIHFFHSIS